MTWYFAYGSNLWIDQMVSRTGPLAFVAGSPRRARLNGYRFEFTMRTADGSVYANIVPADAYVLGALYFCSDEALTKLDAFERGYHRLAIEAVDEAGETTAAVAYRANAENVIDAGQPSAEYVERILRGGRQQGLPENYLRAIERGAGLI